MRNSHSFVALACALIGALAVVPAGAELGSTRLSLPKGPGSIEGLASADFSPNLASGQASYSIPIAVPPAARGFGPSLGLAYDSGAGVSELGLGWRLTGVPSVRRRTQDGLPRFDDTDSFEVVGLGAAVELLEVEAGVYRPRYEDGSFLRAERGEGTWQVRTKSGQRLSFGGPGGTVDEEGHVTSYLLRVAYDQRGHEVRYEWRTDGAYPLLERVVWNEFGPEHENEVSFEYETRPDPSRLFSSGIKQTLSERLTSIDVLHGGELVRRYEVSYSEDHHPRLSSLAMIGADGTSRLPAARFRYSSLALAGGAPAFELIEMQEAPGRSPAEGDASLVDLNGDSLPDLLIGSAGAYESALNLDGVHWEPKRAWTPSESPSFSLSEPGTQLADFDGDGAADLLSSGAGDALRYLARASELAFGKEVVVEGQLDLGLEDPSVRLADFDGDRRTDFALTTSAGLFVARNRDGTVFESSQAVGPIDLEQEVSFERAGTDLCDINGDRLPDVCVLGSGSLVFYLGRGRGSFEPAETATGVPTFEASEPFALRDLNGDGWDDLVRVGVAEVTYALAEGEGRFAAVRSIQDVPTKGPTTFATFADMNGSGSVDIVWVDVTDQEDGSWRYLELFPDGRAGLLTDIDNGLGKQQAIEYAPAAAFAATARADGQAWSSRLNLALPVVTRVSVDSGLGDPILVHEYQYGEGAYDPRERTFAAFGRAVTATLGDESTPTLFTERHFELGLLRRALRGAILFEQKYDEAGVVFSRQSHQYLDLVLDTALDGRAIEYGYRSALFRELVEGDEGSGVVTLLEMEQDEFGNVILERDWGIVVGTDYLAGDDERITIRTFANDVEGWSLGHVATETLENGSGETVAATRKYYDGEAFEGLALGQVERGELTREEAWLGPEPDDYQLVTATSYDEHGLPVETKDARGGGRFFAWDDAHTSLVSEGVKLDPKDEASDVLLVERAQFDGRFGTLLEVTDYAGSVTRYGYDPFGRLSVVVQPGDSFELPTMRYTYEESAPLSRIVTAARLESGKDAVELREDAFDGLGRKRASFVLDAELWLLAGVSLYDARGQVRRTLVPRWVSEVDRRAPPLQVDGAGHETWRDALGREVRTRSAAGIETRTSYEPRRTLHWDGGQADLASPFEHTPTVTVTDGQGRTISHERTLDGEVLAARYTYDAAGRLLCRIDPEGHEQRFSYDGRGRRILVDDPDQGQHRFSYDSSGNLLAHEYPDGARSLSSYDLADRLLSEDWDGDGVPELAQEHDSGSRQHLGKLVRVDEPSGFVLHTYDERGRVTETLYHIEGHDYRVRSAFDAQGREVLHTYPDGSGIRILRNARGQLSGYGELVHIDYGADGIETVRRFSTGVELRSEHDQDGRRTGLEFRDADGAALEHLVWNYDSAGNLTSVLDQRADVPATSDRSEAYSHDNLYRLTGVSGSWGSTEWSYSPSGNLLSRTSTLEPQDAPSIRYGERPHGPSALAGRQIEYDARGRMMSDGHRRYEWDGASQLIRVTLGDARVDSIFGQGGERRVRRERTQDGGTSTTHFIDDWSEVRDGKLVRYVVHSGERIIRLADGPR
jgi:YD repeat-containing protein